MSCEHKNEAELNPSENKISWCWDCGRVKDKTGAALLPLNYDGTGLDLGQRELLIKLQEECLEVAHVVSKILLYGLQDVSPVEPGKGTNKDRLHKELGDVMCFVRLLRDENIVNTSLVDTAAREKLKVLSAWLKHYKVKR